MPQRVSIIDERRKSRRSTPPKNMTPGNYQHRSKKRLDNHQFSHDPTFGLTGVDQGGHQTKPKRIHEANSGRLPTEDDARNRSMYERSPFGLSIGRIDQKYEHWRTVRERKLKLSQDYESQIESMKEKERTREKSYNKFLKSERDKRRTQFHKWGDRRQAAKNYHDRSIKDIEDTSYLDYKKKIRELKKKEKEKAQEEYDKMKEDMSNTFMVAGARDKQLIIQSQQRMDNEYTESRMKLKNLDDKMQTVTNRLNDNFKKRIESLNTQNTRTHEIKTKMDKYEEEAKEKHFMDYFKKQMDYMKRMKKLKKEHNRRLTEKNNKSIDVRQVVDNNKRSKAVEFEMFKDKVKSKHKRINSSVNKESKEHEVSERIHSTNQKRQHRHLKIRNHQKRLQERFKQSVIEKHLTKLRHKEILQKKKEDLMEFSLLKQKEALYER
ncbi:unnamed protein product [Moneuplotes crassus]|uniref:Uncharacterized protein n=3 Tax=Euplotes crassus TaxID=5936 RepID=A0AAD1XAE1_EUPCR|nr:unnamed protein product [Moneuplotes crassus]